MALDAHDEVTRVFEGALTDFSSSIGENARQAIECERQTMLEVCRARREADEVAGQAYGFTSSDTLEMDAAFADRIPPATGKWRVYFGETGSDLDLDAFANRVISWVVGIAFRRWSATIPETLVGVDAYTLLSTPPTKPPALELADGIDILVDDPGFEGSQPHRNNFLRRLRDTFDLLWGDKAQKIEQEFCDILRVPNLREYFCRSGGFFQNHLQLYSKARRKAPIYWPLSTESGTYTLWIYYHRLSDQTLFTCVNDFLDPKLSEIEGDLERLSRSEHIDRNKRERQDNLLELKAELKSMRSQLLDIARLPYKPNLFDGVLINASPLWPMCRHKAWQNELKTCWEDLRKGEYDWSHMAYNIWPDRVRNACSEDRSLAIAHGLEDLYQKKETGKVRRRRK